MCPTTSHRGTSAAMGGRCLNEGKQAATSKKSTRCTVPDDVTPQNVQHKVVAVQAGVRYFVYRIRGKN